MALGEIAATGGQGPILRGRVTQNPYHRYLSQHIVRKKARLPLALLPLAVATPLMFWPKVLETDTQPWVVLGALMAFIFYWPARRGNRIDLSLVILSAFAAIIFVLRSPTDELAIRYSVIMVTFFFLWETARRGAAEYLSTTMKATIVIWFGFGLYQIVAIRFGLPVEFMGRYVATYSGVPSITAEPSFYGSLSILQIMYLITEKNKRNIPFYVLAVCSVMMSGSLLSFLLLAFPAARLPGRWKAMGIITIIVIAVLGINIFESGFFNRLRAFDFAEFRFDLLLSDISLNLRAGHIIFTFWSNLGPQLLFMNSGSFMQEYNAWANSSVLFVPTGSEYILPFAGDLLFRSGVFGLALLFFIFRQILQTKGTRYDRLEKLGFVIACLFNPVSFASPFLIFYVHKNYKV
ncbi:MAG: hypothetical protein QUV08_11190 [Parasphingorhabdus sp.]|nr:hypothetical protein [Parasphingorhabdus sp.]